MCAQLIREQLIPADPSRVWDFFATPRNLDALTPPSLRFQILSEVPEKMYPGLLLRYRISPMSGVWLRWLTEIRHVREGEYFVDEQRSGPYRFWYHEHEFRPEADGVRMIDRVSYEVGWGPLGWLAERAWVDAELKRIFDFRARCVEEIFSRDPVGRR
jgi:ligand-binding SRPBCC domain-containing protein